MRSYELTIEASTLTQKFARNWHESNTTIPDKFKFSS